MPQAQSLKRDATNEHLRLVQRALDEANDEASSQCPMLRSCVNLDDVDRVEAFQEEKSREHLPFGESDGPKHREFDAEGTCAASQTLRYVEKTLLTTTVPCFRSLEPPPEVLPSIVHRALSYSPPPSPPRAPPSTPVSKPESAGDDIDEEAFQTPKKRGRKRQARLASHEIDYILPSSMFYLFLVIWLLSAVRNVWKKVKRNVDGCDEPSMDAAAGEKSAFEVIQALMIAALKKEEEKEKTSTPNSPVSCLFEVESKSPERSDFAFAPIGGDELITPKRLVGRRVLETDKEEVCNGLKESPFEEEDEEVTEEMDDGEVSAVIKRADD